MTYPLSDPVRQSEPLSAQDDLFIIPLPDRRSMDLLRCQTPMSTGMIPRGWAAERDFPYMKLDVGHAMLFEATLGTRGGVRDGLVRSATLQAASTVVRRLIIPSHGAACRLYQQADSAAVLSPLPQQV